LEQKTLQQAALTLARDLAGGVSFLARHLGIGVNALDAMLQGREEIPPWVFFAASDFIDARRDDQYTPPGFPENWRDWPSSDRQR
jgi:hypothetical protein